MKDINNNNTSSSSSSSSSSSRNIQVINEALLNDISQKALASKRLRQNYNFHASLEDPLHRFINVFCRHTFVTPHRHITPPKPESFIMLRGIMLLFIFDDGGGISDCHCLGSQEFTLRFSFCSQGIDIAAGIWHTILAIGEPAVCFEIKPGPYTPISDKDFAPWAPREDSNDEKAKKLWLSRLEKIGRERFNTIF